MRGGGELWVAQAVIDTQALPQLALIGNSDMGARFFSHIISLMYYCQDTVNILKICKYL